MVGVVLVLLALLVGSSARADVADATKQLWAGQYSQCIDSCRKAIDAKQTDENWWLLKIRAEMATGRYADALRTYQSGLVRLPQSLRLRLLGYDVLRMNDQPQQAQQLIEEFRQIGARDAWRFTSAPARVALGRALLLAGADARQILEQLYDRAKKDSPDIVDPYTAAADLAVQKNDMALAAE